jgi:hypothetical protein
MSRLSASAEDNALAGITAGASGSFAGGTPAYLALNSADPGTTGASEIAGSGYARMPITWSVPSAGSVTNASTTLSTTVPAGNTVAWFSTWSTLTTGTYHVGGALNASVTFNSSGTFTIAIGGLSLTAS